MKHFFFLLLIITSFTATAQKEKAPAPVKNDTTSYKIDSEDFDNLEDMTRELLELSKKYQAVQQQITTLQAQASELDNHFKDVTKQRTTIVRMAMKINKVNLEPVEVVDYKYEKDGVIYKLTVITKLKPK